MGYHYFISSLEFDNRLLSLNQSPEPLGSRRIHTVPLHVAAGYLPLRKGGCEGGPPTTYRRWGQAHETLQRWRWPSASIASPTGGLPHIDGRSRTARSLSSTTVISTANGRFPKRPCIALHYETTDSFSPPRASMGGAHAEQRQRIVITLRYSLEIDNRLLACSQ